jgi:hypothetical protein
LSELISSRYWPRVKYSMLSRNEMRRARVFILALYNAVRYPAGHGHIKQQMQITKHRANTCRRKSNASHTTRFNHMSEIKSAMSQFAKLLFTVKDEPRDFLERATRNISRLTILQPISVCRTCCMFSMSQKGEKDALDSACRRRVCGVSIARIQLWDAVEALEPRVHEARVAEVG